MNRETGLVGWVSVACDAQPTMNWWVAPTSSADPPYQDCQPGPPVQGPETRQSRDLIVESPPKTEQDRFPEYDRSTAVDSMPRRSRPPSPHGEADVSARRDHPWRPG
jgi:hypothetical protein